MNYSVNDQIVDACGRVGIVTEVSEDNKCVFARPIERNYTEPFRDGNLIMATAWTVCDDGSLHGLWADSPLNAFTIANKKG